MLICEANKLEKAIQELLDAIDDACLIDLCCGLKDCKDCAPILRIETARSALGV